MRTSNPPTRRGCAPDSTTPRRRSTSSTSSTSSGNRRAAKGWARAADHCSSRLPRPSRCARASPTTCALISTCAHARPHARTAASTCAATVAGSTPGRRAPPSEQSDRAATRLSPRFPPERSQGPFSGGHKPRSIHRGKAPPPRYHGRHKGRVKTVRAAGRLGAPTTRSVAASMRPQTRTR
jgi:hypothetical protein